MTKNGELICAHPSTNRRTTEAAKATIPPQHEAESAKGLLIHAPMIKIEDYDAKADFTKLPRSEPVFKSEEWDSQHFFADQPNHGQRRTQSCNSKLETIYLQHHDAQTECVSSRSVQTKQPRERRNLSKGTTSRSGRSRRLFSAHPRDISPTLDPESSSDDDNDDRIFETPKRDGNPISDQPSPLTPPSSCGSDNGSNPNDDQSPSRGRLRRPPPKLYPRFDPEAGRHLRGFDKAFPINGSAGNAEELPVAPSRSTKRAPPSVAAETPRSEQDGVTTDGANTSETKAEKKDDKYFSTTVKAEKTVVHGIRLLDEYCKCDLLQRIKASKPRQCAASSSKFKKNSIQCKNVVPGRKNNELAIEYLENLQRPQDIARCLKDLKAAIGLLFCSRWHHKYALDALGEWVLVHRAALPIEELLHSPPFDIYEDTNSNLREAAATSKISTEVPNKRIDPDWTVLKIWFENAQRCSQNGYDFRETEARSASARKQILSIYIQNLQPYVTKSIRSLNTSECLRNAITGPLSQSRDLGSGFLYMYCFPGNFGVRKIGVTTQDIKKRLRRWMSQCGHTAELLYPKNEIKPITIPHVFRLEKIVFAELKEFRLQEVGCKCEKTHREWFMAKDSHILEVVDRWTKWIMQEPYEKIRDTWQLKAIEREALDRLCIPLSVLNSGSPFSKGI